MGTVIVRTGVGNVFSVMNALRRMGDRPVLTADEEKIRGAGRVIFPGVGDASTAMKFLQRKGLDRVIPDLTCPVLGICLGLQLMCRYSEESDTECLGIFDQTVVRFPRGMKVPHVGWNRVRPLKGALAGEKEENFYFVHSYFTEVGEYTSMDCHYIDMFSAGLERDNFYALQFHPEKSGYAGEAVLKRFLELPGGGDE